MMIFGASQRCNQSSSNIDGGTFDKIVININLKALSILAKRLILDVCVQDLLLKTDTLQLLKFKYR